MAFYGEVRRQYGPTLYSQFYEESLIRHFFRDRREGFFVDVGASHYQIHSNTYFLESKLGWHGIAVDALDEYRIDYERFRRNTRFFAAFVSNRAGEMADFTVSLADKRTSTGIEALLPELVADAGLTHLRIPTVTLNGLLDGQGVKKVDLLSLDIEGAEPLALEGFDIERFRPDLVCVEIRELTEGSINRYFARHGYVEVDRYRLLDGSNRYFAPPGF